MSGSSSPGLLRGDCMTGSAGTVLGSLSRWARTTPGATAIRLYDENAEPLGDWSYLELAASVAGAARRLQERVATDDAVLLQAPNGFEYVVWLLGGLMAGVRVATAHPSSTVHELTRIAGSTRARLIIGPHPLAPLEHMPLDDWAARSDGTITLPHRRAEGSIILQSSGTGGPPKLARRTEASLDADARGLAEAANLSTLDRVLVVVPLSHSFGIDLLAAAIHSGASLHMLERFELACVLILLERGAATVLPGVPFMFEALARARAATLGVSLRIALSAGTPLPECVFDELRTGCGLCVGQLYGATELGTVALSVPGGTGFHPRSVGMPVRGASVRIVAPGEPDRALPADAEGEVAVMAPSMLTEYLDGALPLVDGHFLTGDLGRIDRMGRLYVTGRLKQLIDIGGLKVNPLEVEEVFGGHPGIADCALAPLPLSETVVRLRLLYVPRAGASPKIEDLRTFARDRLSPYKLPRVFEQVAALPRSTNGKLLRNLLNQA